MSAESEALGRVAKEEEEEDIYLAQNQE